MKFIKVYHSTSNMLYRINVNSIISYCKNEGTDGTIVYYGAVDARNNPLKMSVTESPEEIDKMIAY